MKKLSLIVALAASLTSAHAATTKSVGVNDTDFLVSPTNFAYRIIGAGDGITVTPTNFGGATWGVHIDSSGGGVTTPGIVYLGTNGNDATAVVGNPSKPFQNFSNALYNIPNNGGMVVYAGVHQTLGFVPATYEVMTNAFAKLTNKNNITIIGMGNAVIHTTNDGVGFLYHTMSNLTMQGLTFRGTQTNNTYQIGGMFPHGMITGYYTNENIVFQNCRFETCNYFAIVSGQESGGLFSESRNFYVTLSTFFKCGYTNMSGGSQNPDGGCMNMFPGGTVTSCRFQQCGRGFEYFGGNTTGPSYAATVRDCFFDRNWSRDLFCIAQNYIHNLLVDHCVFIIDPAARKPGEPPITLRFIKDATIQNCLFTNMTGIVAIQTVAAAYGELDGLSLLNNTFVDISVSAVVVDFVYGFKATGNKFIRCLSTPLVAQGKQKTITENYFKDCTGNNIQVANGTNDIIAYNSFTHDSGSASSYINIASGTGAGVYFNKFTDNIGSTPWIIDGGINTRIWNPTISTLDSNDHMIVRSARHIPFTAPTGMGESTQQVAFRLFALTNNVTVTNTTSVTSFITNALWGTQIIPANALRPGTRIRIRAFGHVHSVSANIFETGIRFNAGLLLATNLAALPTTLVNDTVIIELEGTVRSVGASGSIIFAGLFGFPSTTGVATSIGYKRIQFGNFPGAVTVDTTVAQVVDLYFDPGATTHGITIVEAVCDIIP